MIRIAPTFTGFETRTTPSFLGDRKLNDSVCSITFRHAPEPNIMEDVEIQRRPLATLPTDRLNAYNRHSLAPWLEETGYLTPLYLHRREQERIPFNMSRWMTDNISKHMLHPPTAIFDLDHELVTQLLKIAASCQYTTECAKAHADELSQIANTLPHLPASSTGYFVRLSESSPKDVDDGNLQAIQTVVEALQKLVCSKRAVQALLAIHDSEDEDIDNKLYFFPYHSTLDRLSEWRCYIHESRVVAISQSRFYQPHHVGVTDTALQEMVSQARNLWRDISSSVQFTSCALDLYAQVHRPNFEVKLIEINPYYPHIGSGSLLFHWLDNADILLPLCPSNKTVVRLVKPDDKVKTIGRKEAYNIGRSDIIQDELKVLKSRGLEWILEDVHHKRFMELRGGGTTRQAGLEKFRSDKSEERSPADVAPHPRFRKVQEAYMQQKT